MLTLLGTHGKASLMTPNQKLGGFDSRQLSKLAPIWRAMVVIGFLMFLLFSILLMREFTVANGQGRNLVFAIQDISTVTNFVIGSIAALLGFLVLEYLRIHD